MNTCFDILICPVCKSPLQQIDRALKCRQNHTFDLAREGYANLLLPRKKLSDTVGDNPDMLQARRRFLEAGHYALLSHAINQLVEGFLTGRPHSANPANILDAGCGEGYYLGRLQSHLPAVFPESQLCFAGVDVSKTAVRYAAKRYKNGRFFVSDINTLIPVADQSVTVLLNIFAPRNPLEFARMTAPGSRLLIVIPKPCHLRAMRERFNLLQIAEDKQAGVITRFAASFQLQEVVSVEDTLTLTPQAAADLLQMTPNARHLTTADWKVVAKVEAIITEIGFDLLQFSRN